MIDQDDFWTVARPQQWPSPPERFSMSSLSEIENCPRRWALANATYSFTGVSRYPRKPSLAAVRGSAIHGALERIAQSLEQNDAQTSADVVETLTSLGGLTAVVSQAIRVAAEDLGANPRSRQQARSGGQASGPRALRRIGNS